MTLSIFRLTDGTQTINLLSNELDGFYLREYAPILSGYKGGGLFQDSPLADNRRPVYTRRNTVVQPVVLDAKAISHDNMARMLQDLLRLLEKAKDYWVSDWQNTPVWLEAKTAKETNTRYALVYMGRLEDYPPPYQQPFTQEGGTPVATEMTLFLEIGQWLDVNPMTEGGVSINSSVQLGLNPHAEVTFTVEASTVGGSPVALRVPADASIQDLPDGANGFTIDCWIKPERFVNVFATPQFFPFRLYKGVGSSPIQIDGQSSSTFITCTIRFSTTNAIRRVDATPIVDNEWHHLAITFNKNGTFTPRIWFDGVEQLGGTSVVGSGTYSGDTGNNIDLTMYRDGDESNLSIQYLRLSDIERWTSNFTPPEMCTKPTVDANTAAQWNFFEGSGSTVDNVEGTAATDIALDPGSDDNFSYEWSPLAGCDQSITPTTDELFVANKLSAQVITNVHVGTAGANLIGGSWPATVFSGTTDAYFGSTDGVFNNVVLDIDVGATTTPTWQYWNGAWTTLTISNILSPDGMLGVTGQVIVSWKPPADWVAASPGGSIPSGFFVRQTANIGTIAHNGPNDPYTVTWPFIQVADTQLPGDIPNLARMLLRPVGSDGTNNSSGAADKIIYGVRSLERGQAFRSHINMADTGNVSGIFIDAGSGTFTSNNDAPTGRLISYTATTTPTAVGGAFINGAISRDYAGRFRVFIRFSYQLLTTATTLTWVFRVQYGSNGSYFDSRPVVIDDTYEGSSPLTNPYLLEFNPIQIRSDLLVGTTQEVGEIIFYPFVSTDQATATVYLHDIVLIPTDEFSGEVERSPQSSNQASALSLIDLDGTNQKLYNRAVKRNVSNNRIEELWLSRGVLPPSLQANATQRVFFLQRSTAGASSPEQSVSFQTLGVQMGKVSRYLGFRGDR